MRYKMPMTGISLGQSGGLNMVYLNPNQYEMEYLEQVIFPSNTEVPYL